MPSESQSHFEFLNWKDVEGAASRVVAESHDPFDPETAQNLSDLICAVPESCPLPIGVAKGSWSTVRILWEAAEIEIFDDRYELYRLGQSRMAIEYFQRAPNERVPPDLIDRLLGAVAAKE